MSVPSIGSNLSISGYTAVQCTGNPEQDAKSFADANGISVEEAKSILENNFGFPEAEQEKTNSDLSDVTKETPDVESVLSDATSSNKSVGFSFGLTEDQKEIIEGACDNFIGSLENAEACYQNVESNPEDTNAQEAFMEAMSEIEAAAQELAKTIQEIDQEAYMNMMNNPYQAFTEAMNNQNIVNAMYMQDETSFEEVTNSYTATSYASSLILQEISRLDFVQ